MRSISDVNSLEIIKKHIHKYTVITTQRKSKAFPKVDSKNKQSSYSQLGREREREKEIYKYRSTISKLTKKHL